MIFRIMSTEDKKYKVVKYFDDYPETVIAKGLTYEEAKILKDSRSSNAHVYVSYEIRDDAE